MDTGWRLPGHAGLEWSETSKGSRTDCALWSLIHSKCILLSRCLRLKEK